MAARNGRDPTASDGRRNPLAQALREYGRLVRTNFVLALLADEELRGSRRAAARQGQAAPRSAPRDLLRQRRPCPAANADQQAEQALCLAIVVNAIIVCNTVDTGRVLDELPAAGELITTSEIEHISSLARQHIHLRPLPLSTSPPGRTGTGPLRAAAMLAASAQETLDRG